MRPVSRDPPQVAVSDFYLDFLRSGIINVSHGKLSALRKTTATLEDGTKLGNIAAVVLATGFEASDSIRFLPESVLQKLSFSPEHPSHPVALAFHGTYHPEVPSLGFVGFYRGPYWSVMEMQARLVATMWSNPVPTQSLATALEQDQCIARTLSLRHDKRCSQFPMGDYLFIIDQIATALGMNKTPLPEDLVPPQAAPEDKAMDLVTPSRYLSTPSDHDQAAESLSNIRETNRTATEALNSNRFVARAVFRSLLGAWKLNRTLRSKLPSHPSGQFIGTAEFQLREGTRDGREDENVAVLSESLGQDLEYLYQEEGEFRADNGLVFRATRKYVWRYVEARDELSVWFTREGKTGHEGNKADYLFHIVEFEGTTGCNAAALCPLTGLRQGAGGREPSKPLPETTIRSDGKQEGWRAKAGHLCIDDFYDVNYEFGFYGVNLGEWTIEYNVRGPKKDYSIRGVYTRC